MAGYGYRAQLPQSVVQRLVAREPSAGAAVAAGVGQLAQAVGQGAERIDDAQSELAERERRRDLARRNADIAARVAAAEEADAAAEVEDRKPGFAGYADRRRERIAKSNETILGEEAAPELIERWAPVLAGRKARTYQGALNWELAESSKAEGQARNSVENEGLNVLGRTPTLAALDVHLATVFATIDGSSLTDPEKAAQKTGVETRGWAKLLDGLPVDQREKLLDSGTLDRMLPNDLVDNYRKGIAVDRKEAALAVEREAKAAQDAQRDVNADILLRAENGDASAAEVAQAQRRSAELGLDPVDVSKLGYAMEAAGQGKRFAGMTTPELETEAEALRARERAGKLTDAAEVRRLELLDKTIGGRDDKDGGDLSALWKAGPEGQAEVSNRLAATPIAQRMRVAGKMGVPKMTFVANLPDAERATALAGGRIRVDATRKNAFMPMKPDGKESDPALATQAFRNLMGLPLLNDLGDQASPIVEAALDYYVGSQASAGVSGEWNPREFAKAVRSVTGGVKRPDGKYQGGIGTVRGEKVWLPDRWTDEEVARATSRQSFDGAVLRDGRAANKADILANFRMVPVEQHDDGGMLYRFEDASGRPLKRKVGGDWMIRLSRDPGTR